MFRVEGEQLLHRNVQQFRGGLEFKAQRLCVSLYSSLGRNKEEEKLRVGDRRCTSLAHFCLVVLHFRGHLRLDDTCARAPAWLAQTGSD